MSISARRRSSIYQLVAKEPMMSAVRILLHSRLHVRRPPDLSP